MAAGRRLRLAALLLGLAAGLSGCGVAADVGHTFDAAHKFAASDFCADLMSRAYPQASFSVTDKTSKEHDLTLDTVTVTAKRTDVQPGTGLSTDVAVECTFDHNVLTGFRWTKGPFQPA